MNTSSQLKKAANVIPKTKLVLQEFLAVLAGKKPVMIYAIDPDDRKLIKDNFPQINIVCRSQIVWNKKAFFCALSKDKSLAKKAIDIFCSKNGGSFELLGDLMGYPRCCVESHLRHCEQGKELDFALITYQTHKASKKCNFLVNNLLNFSTRVGGEESSDFIRYSQLNKNLAIPYQYFQFISHNSCKYDCQESIKIGKETDYLLKEYAPKIEKIVKYTLSKPILFFDLFKLIIFDGYLGKGILHYQKIIPPFFPIDSLLIEKIENGNRIIIDNKKIKILKNDSILFTYQKKNEADGFILDFSENDKKF